MKLCIDCHYFWGTKEGPQCRAFPAWTSPIDNSLIWRSCWDQRLSVDVEDCGQEAKWFKPKEPIPFS